MNDEQVLKLMDEEYGLSEKQAVLNNMLHDMKNQLEKLKQQHNQRMKTEIKKLREENGFLLDKLKNKSK